MENKCNKKYFFLDPGFNVNCPDLKVLPKEQEKED